MAVSFEGVVVVGLSIEQILAIVVVASLVRVVVILTLLGMVWFFLMLSLYCRYWLGYIVFLRAVSDCCWCWSCVTLFPLALRSRGLGVWLSRGGGGVCDILEAGGFLGGESGLGAREY